MIYKAVLGFEAYRVRDDGVIESNWRSGYYYPNIPNIEDKWKVLKNHETPEGYSPLVLIRWDGFRRKTHLHRIVAETFLGPPPYPKACVRHLDGNSRNNNVTNLAWGTYKDNEHDKKAHGTFNKRITNGKLTPDNIAEILLSVDMGIPRKDLAKKFNVTITTIGRVINGLTWK